MFLRTMMLLMVSTVPHVMCQVTDCTVFKAAACPLIEENIVGFENSAEDTESCQQSCADNTGCNYFTHFETQCYQLVNCTSLSICPDCISGPPSPPFSSCPWPPVTTSPPPDTTTTETITTTATSCDVFSKDMVCELDDMNIIESVHGLSVGECQDACTNTTDCSWFTWYPDPTPTCWLLEHCDVFEMCSGCISGPATGVDVDDCFDSPTTDSPTPATTMATTTCCGLSTTGSSTPTTTDLCGMFHEAACDIDEMNQVAVRHDLTVGMCQDACTTNPVCHWFTWYPSLGQLGTCWLLKHCNQFDTCPYCVSGPDEGADVDDCIETTTETPQTTTVDAGSTTNEPSTAGGGCNMFTSTACDIDEDNNLDVNHDLTVGMCQDVCAANPTCKWFTWNNVSGLLGTCWLLDHCNSQEPCPSCVSGPAEGPDVDTC